MIRDSNTIMIIGMQRSGTSALAGALAQLGLFFGKEDLLYRGDANNPQGYYEHRKATLLNLRCLHTFQMHPTSLTRLPSHWKHNPLAESFQAELKEFLTSEFGKSGPWGIKQPVTSLVLPLYNTVFEEMGIRPHYVLCVRSPLETMASEAQLEFGNSYRVMPSLGMRAIGSWLRYTLVASDLMGQSLSVVAYDDLISQPRETLSRIIARHPGWRPTEAQWDAAVQSIKPELRHNRVEMQELDVLPPIVKRSYATVTRFQDSDQASWDSMVALQKELETWTELLGEPEPAAGKLGLAWVDDGKPYVVEVPFLPTGDWQTVTLRVNAPPKANLNGLLYGPPYRAWIRRATWRMAEARTPAVVQPGLGSELAVEGTLIRIDGVFEPNQINLTTPGGAGPYDLEIEFLLETGPVIVEEAAARLARRLEECVANFERILSPRS